MADEIERLTTEVHALLGGAEPEPVGHQDEEAIRFLLAMEISPEKIRAVARYAGADDFWTFTAARVLRMKWQTLEDQADRGGWLEPRRSESGPEIDHADLERRVRKVMQSYLRNITGATVWDMEPVKDERGRTIGTKYVNPHAALDQEEIDELVADTEPKVRERIRGKMLRAAR